MSEDIEAVSVPAIAQSIPVGAMTEHGVVVRAAAIGDTVLYVQRGSGKDEPTPDFLTRVMQRVKERRDE